MPNGQLSIGSLHVIPNFKPIYRAVTAATGADKTLTEVAVQFSGLAQAFYARFRKPLYVSEAYRNIARQRALRADYLAGRGALAAIPATSNHGWGKALDVASGVNQFGTAEHNWMAANVGAYGFRFTVPSEAWHIDYVGGATHKVRGYIANPNTLTPTVSPALSQAVKNQQARLNYWGAKLKVDGIPGPKFKAATIAFQKAHKLPADGVIGPRTWAELQKNKPAPKPKPAKKKNRGILKLGTKNGYVRTLQTALGLKRDGVFGPQTKEAVIKFQKSKGLTPDGVVGPSTWRALGL